VALDGQGNVYVADFHNHRIRKVSAAGTITTVAGTGTGGFSGDQGPATSANLRYPAGVEVDGQGSLYIADSYNHRVRKVDASGTITTLAGAGTTGFNGDGPATGAQLNVPLDVVVDRQGVLVIADTENHRVRSLGPLSPARLTLDLTSP
jgi:sugar lactone lactonase YvrE